MPKIMGSMGIRIALVVDFVIVGFVLAIGNAAALNVPMKQFGDFFTDFNFGKSIVDLSILAMIRCALSFYLLYYPQSVVQRDTLTKIRKSTISKACWRSKFGAGAGTTVYFNYALAKCLALLVSDAEDNRGPDKSPFKETSEVAFYWIAITLTMLLSIYEYRRIKSDVNDFEDKTLKLRRQMKKDPSLVVVNDSSSDSSTSLTAPLITQENEDNEDSDSDDDEDDEEAYQILLKSMKKNSNVTEGDKYRLRERMNRIKRRNRKKRREKEEKADRSTKASVRQLLDLSAPDIWYLSFAFFCLVIAAVAQAFIPKYTGKIFTSLTRSNDTNDTHLINGYNQDSFYNSINMLVASAIVCGVFSGLRGATFTVCMARLIVRVRKKLFISLLYQEVGYFDVTNIGDITSRLSADTTKLGDQISLNINVLLRSLVEGVLYLVLMFSLSWKLALLTFISIPLMTVISNIYGNYYRKLSKYTQDALADANTIAEEALGAITTVRDFAAQTSELESYSEELQEYYNLNLKQSYAYSGFALTWTTIPSLVTALTLYYGGKLVMEPDNLDSHLEIGDLVSFMFYQQSLSRTLSSISAVFTGIAGALGAADKVFQLINRKPKISPPGELKLKEEEFEGSMVIDNISFKYPARPTVTVLKDFTLTVPSGKVVALVGPSGGGKSSCMRLLQHYYEPESGGVYISNRPVSDFDQSWLRKHVAIVGQEPTLFGRSIRRNIMYGLEGTELEPTQDQIEEAARLSNAHDFIMNMPKGYDTEVGERGVQLSGGQKQRIALARSLVRKPTILLLDEATSALDTESEAIVQAALDKIMRQRGRTVLVIAHRLSTVKDADIIVVIANGGVAEQGTHNELVEKGGVYASLIQRQLEGYAGENDEKEEASATIEDLNDN